MERFLDFLVTNLPGGGWLLIGGAVVWLYFIIKNKAEKASEKAAEVKARIDKLPCEAHVSILEKLKDGDRDRDIRIERISTGMEYINKNISDISKNITAIAEKMKADIIPATVMTQSTSPLTLTDKGREKMQELGVDEMLRPNWDSILELISEKAGSKNPYDVQQICLDEAILFPEKFVGAEGLNKLKLDAYRNGDILQSYMRAISVIVRDRYFKQQGIEISDIDRHAPNQE
jgi:hypothetical protein